MGKNQSKLPFVKWPTEENAQREALKSSRQLEEFRAYREKIRGHVFTPDYHFCAPDGNLNDPNGFCYWKGYYHLFYQEYPPVDPRQHWGHAISKDLIHWEDLPTAIYPDPEEAVFSGSILIEEDRAIAMYHGPGVGNFIAISTDPLLLNWEKLTGDAVLKPVEGAPWRVFDPHLRREADGYYALSGVTKMTPAGPRMTEQQFFSKDLIHWEYIGELMDENQFLIIGEDGACPYFIHAKDDQYFLFHFSHESGPHVLSGAYDPVTHKFKPHHHLGLSFEAPGAGTIHAPSAFSDGEGGAYVIYNATDARKHDPAYPRQGMMTMVYHVTLGDFKEPVFAPVAAVDNLHDGILYEGRGLKIERGSEFEIPAMGKSLDIQLDVDVKNANGFGLDVFRSDKENTSIRFIERHDSWRDRAYITIDATRSSLDPLQMGKAPEAIRVWGSDENGKVSVRVLLDRCSIEVFIHGEVVYSTAYPTLPESNRLFLSPTAGDITVDSVRVFGMKRVF